MKYKSWLFTISLTSVALVGLVFSCATVNKAELNQITRVAIVSELITGPAGLVTVGDFGKTTLGIAKRMVAQALSAVGYQLVPTPGLSELNSISDLSDTSTPSGADTQSMAQLEAMMGKAAAASMAGSFSGLDAQNEALSKNRIPGEYVNGESSLGIPVATLDDQSSGSGTNRRGRPANEVVAEYLGKLCNQLNVDAVIVLELKTNIYTTGRSTTYISGGRAGGTLKINGGAVMVSKKGVIVASSGLIGMDDLAPMNISVPAFAWDGQVATLDIASVQTQVEKATAVLLPRAVANPLAILKRTK